MNTEQERAAFEAWYRLHHGSLDVYGRDASGEYADKQVQGAFNVWQARAALAAQPAAATTAPSDENGGHRLVEPDYEIMLVLADAPRSLQKYVAALQAENERLRAEVAEWKRVAAAQAELHGEAEERAERLRNLLRRVHPIVQAHAGASHLLEGFRPKRNQWDELVDAIDAAMQRASDGGAA